MSTEAETNQRRVRPWIAALLTFLGPGVGLFYARRTRAAIWLVVVVIVLNFVLGGALYAYMLHTDSVPSFLSQAASSGVGDYIGLAITAIVAVGV